MTAGAEGSTCTTVCVFRQLACLLIVWRLARAYWMFCVFQELLKSQDDVDGIGTKRKTNKHGDTLLQPLDAYKGPYAGAEDGEATKERSALLALEKRAKLPGGDGLEARAAFVCKSMESWRQHSGGLINSVAIRAQHILIQADSARYLHLSACLNVVSKF